MKKILLPVDFSSRSVSTSKYGAALACGSHAELTVLHVAPACASHAEVKDISSPPAYPLEVAWHELPHKEATEKMTEFVNCHLRGIPLTPCVRTGDAANVIVEQAHATEADLIVMSTHGFGDFRRMLLGSVTAKVLHDARCPVFTTTHAESAPATLPPLRNVICAVDFGPQSEAVLRWADEFARSMGARLFVSHVVPIIPMGQWGHCDQDVSVAMRKDAELKAHQLVETVGANAKVFVESGPIVETLSELVKDKHADVLVIGRHHESGALGRLRDRAYAIIRESPCPVVSV